MTPITERSVLELARAISRRKLSATEVVRAHIERHQLWGRRINALVAERFEAPGTRRRHRTRVSTAGAAWLERPSQRCRSASPSRGCGSGFRSRPDSTATMFRSRLGIELERVFGGWVPPETYV
jgi:hypothetical protein